jgi:hypothetical protein
MITITQTDPVVLGTSTFNAYRGSVQYIQYHWSELYGMAFAGCKADLESLGLPVGRPVEVGDQFYDIDIDVEWNGTPRSFTFHAKEKRHVLRVAQALTAEGRQVTVVCMARILARFDEGGWLVGPVRTLDEFYIDLDPDDITYAHFEEDMVPTLHR